MKKSHIVLFTLMMAWSAIVFAAPQEIALPGTFPLDADGVADGVIFTTPAADATSTVTVGDGENVNDGFPGNGFTSGISTTAPLIGSVTFLGTTNASTVKGTVGAINPLLNISGGLGASTIIFNGATSAATINITGNGTMQFDSSSNGAVQFNTDGTLIIGGGATFTGALTNLTSNTGTLTLGSASTLIGAVAVGTSPLKQINVLAGNSNITGAVSATNYSLLTNTLTIDGALTIPDTNPIINTTLISNVVFGNIAVSGNDDILAPLVTINADVTQALLTPGQPIFIVDAAAGTSGRTILVNSNSARYTFVGLNLNGDITITPTLAPSSEVTTNPSAAAVGTILNALLPVAAANPGSDLAFVQLQLNTLTTAEELEDALLQIAPASGLIGVARESFNATRQFQGIWLKHLQHNRCRVFNSLCCDPCDPCYDSCNSCYDPCNSCCEEGIRVWADGFGYYGHQDNKDDFNGYKVNTWGTMLAAETPVYCGLRLGLGAGYAYTKLDQRRFGNNTRINNYVGTAYFSYNPNDWFLDGGFSYGWHRYNGTRHIEFAAIDRTARAKYNGKEYTGFLATGYQWSYNCIDITPFASLMYSRLHLDSYTEKNADFLNMHVSKQHYKFLQSGLGLKAEYLYQTCYGIYIPEIHSIWLHDYYNNGLNADASFTGLGAVAGSFPNRGPKTDRDTWNIGGSLTFMANDHFSAFVVYDYERSSTYFDHQWMLEVAYDF